MTKGLIRKTEKNSTKRIGTKHIKTKRCLDDCATPQLDIATLRPAPSDTVTIRPTNIFILRQSDPTGSDSPTTPKPLSSAP